MIIIGDNYDWCPQYSHQSFGTETGRLGDYRTSGNHPKLLRLARILRRVLET